MKMKKEDVLKAFAGGLIVSCQALPEEPLHSPFIMGRMALAAKLGGAVGIRANSTADIREIASQVDLPIIGIVKAVTPGCEVYITPTRCEVDALAQTGVAVIAMDATGRPRPDGLPLARSFPSMRAAYPDMLFMADCACLEDGLRAQDMGFDMVGTTLAGYTAATAGCPLPALSLMGALVEKLSIPVVAEGGIHSPEDMAAAFDQGVHCCVVGGAITRPMEITRRFVDALPKKE